MKVQIGWKLKVKTSGVTPPPPIGNGVPAYITPVPTSATLTSGSPTRSIVSQVFDAGNTLLGNTLYYTSSNTAVATVDQTGLVTRIGVGSCTITVSTIPPTTGVNSAIGTTSSLAFNRSGLLALTTFDNGGTGSWTLNGADSVIADPSGLLGGNVLRQPYVTAGANQDNNHETFFNYPTGVALGSTFFMRGDLVVQSTTAPNDGSSFAKLYYPKFARYANNGWVNGGDNPAVGNGLALVRRDGGGHFDAQLANTPVNGIGNEFPFGTSILVALATKYRIKYQVRLNSGIITYDGYEKLWINGLLVVNRTGLTWTDPLWATTRTAWNSGVTYSPGSVVYYNSQVWCSLVSSNLNVPPGTDATKWIVPDPTKARFGEFAIGTQLQSSVGSVSEVRLWKNLLVSLQDPGDADPTGADV